MDRFSALLFHPVALLSFSTLQEHSVSGLRVPNLSLAGTSTSHLCARSARRRPGLHAGRNTGHSGVSPVKDAD